jgi:hypothetical protein
MSKGRKGSKFFLLILVAALLIAQAFRIDKTNPPGKSEISADPAIHQILRRACYNCHSNETIWPWYSNVAPVSWLLASDVSEGRSHVNFSAWGAYGSNVQSHKFAAIGEEVRGGDMPPWYYTLVHAEARLSSADRDEVGKWAESASQNETPR